MGVTRLAAKAGLERGVSVLGVEGVSRKKALPSGTAYRKPYRSQKNPPGLARRSVSGGLFFLYLFEPAITKWTTSHRNAAIAVAVVFTLVGIFWFIRIPKAEEAVAETVEAVTEVSETV